jgi:hypothetical protein
MTVTQREDWITKLGTILAFIFVGQTLFFVLPLMVTDGNLVTGQVPGSFVIRWLAFLPAMMYLALVVLSIPQPRMRARPSRRGRSIQIPQFDRFPVFVLGFILITSTGAQSVFLIPQGSGAAYLLYPSYIIIGAWLLHILRMILGLFRLVPRSWRIAPDPAPTETPIGIPDQRFAPSRSSGRNRTP